MLLSPLRVSLHVLFYSGVTLALLRFEKGAYKNVIVAFDRGRIRDEKEFKNLEKLIKDASRELYIATQGLAYFREVWVVAAHHDNDIGSGEIVGRSSVFSKADIRIGSTNMKYRTPEAFTLQPGGCGEQGKFIFLSESFFKDLDSEKGTKLAARRLVQEWVRYRYGVFDEVVKVGDELFRWEGTTVEPLISPSTCANGIRGWAMTEKHERCVQECGVVRSDCRFFPDLKSYSRVESSLMFCPHLPNVKYFCNNSNHNERAASMQNRMCHFKSIMEVIRDHDDFKDADRWLDKSFSPQKHLPHYVLFRFDSLRELEFLFVVESSPQMDEKKWTQEVQHFIERFFEHLAPRRARAWFIKFSDRSKTLWMKIPVKIKDRWQRDEVLNVSAVFGSPSAFPDIGKALREAYQKYRDEFADPEVYNFMRFPTIFLISTTENEFRFEVERHDSWEEQKMATIHSIVVGRKLNWNLDYVSHMTGGDSYFLGDGGSKREEPRSFNLDMAFLASIHSIADDHEQPVVILYKRFKTKTKSWEEYFLVDDGIGKDLVVTVSPNYADNLRLMGNRPKSYKPSYRMHTYNFSSTTGSIFVDDAEPGKWGLKLKGSLDEQATNVDVMITAKPRQASLQGSWVWARAWIANVTKDKKIIGTKGYHCIYAEVKKGHSPVINAKVEAVVEMRHRSPINVTLRDNGGVPDVFKYDGVYSNFFPVTIRGPGRPVVIVRVSNNDGKAMVKIVVCNNSGSAYGMLDDDDYQRTIEEFGTSQSRFFPGYFSPKRDFCKEREEAVQICNETLKPFTRVAMANSPILFPINRAEVLHTPPAAIWDLKVVEEFKRGEDIFVAVLQWTSPEHPQPMTKVKTIEVHYSRNRSLITSKHLSSETIIKELGNIAPAGTVQQFRAEMLRSMVEDHKRNVQNMYFVLRALDNANNKGEMSNIAEASFMRPEMRKDKILEGGKEKEISSWLPWTVGVVTVVVVIVAAAVSAIGYLKWKKKGRMRNARDIPTKKPGSWSCSTVHETSFYVRWMRNFSGTGTEGCNT